MPWTELAPCKTSCQAHAGKIQFLLRARCFSFSPVLPKKEEKHKKAERQLFKIDILSLKGSVDSVHAKRRSSRPLLSALLLELNCISTRDTARPSSYARWTCGQKTSLSLVPHSLVLHFCFLRKICPCFPCTSFHSLKMYTKNIFVRPGLGHRQSRGRSCQAEQVDSCTKIPDCSNTLNWKKMQLLPVENSIAPLYKAPSFPHAEARVAH